MATLQKVGDTAQCPITLQQMKIGRADDNEIVIEDDAVSAYHALVTEQIAEQGAAKSYLLEDLDSTNHTYVNNKPVKSHELKDGDIIRIGRTRLKFSTADYTVPQEDFQKTTKISPGLLQSFLRGKSE